MNIKPTMMSEADKKAVGNLGTVRVNRNSLNTGIKSNREKENEINDPIEKKIKGFFSLNNLITINKILKPSLRLFNLLIEPSGLATYLV